jgi:hypothetical protein
VPQPRALPAGGLPTPLPRTDTFGAPRPARASESGARSADAAPRTAPPILAALRDAAAPAPRQPARGAANPAELRPLAAVLPLAAALAPPQRAWLPAFEAAPRAVPPGSLLERAPLRVEDRPAAPPPALGTVFQNRVGAAKAQALAKFGGTDATERAVRRGLEYLARIQNDDGSWGSRRRSNDKYGHTMVGKSGLCLLAFLGAGHTPISRTEHSDAVAKTITFLLDEQDEDTGHFGYTSAYSHGVCTYALAECYGMVEDAALRERLRRPVTLALDWIVHNQDRSRDRRSRGGWGYFSPFLEPEDGFARTSVSAWMVMALESAKLSGFAVGQDVLDGAREFLLQAWDRENGYFLYNREPSRLRSTWRTLPASTPAALFSLQLIGIDVRDERMRIAFDYVLERRPTDYRAYGDDEFVRMGAGNVYFWYYATLATFLAGGEVWEQWNRALREVLPAGQEADGSWPSIGPYDRYAGDNARDRSYSTAMCVLSLEIYYRYFTPLLRGK